ncbi:MAG TPA: hypothetical protein VMT14_10405, partial [Burkholderiaceae bacterium]|nr:hypothetical protein [Burkholderiaceae bacterium]
MTLSQHFAQRLCEVEVFGLLLCSALGEARDLLAHHAGAAGVLDLAHEHVKARAVDAAGRLQLERTLKRLRQRRGDFDADLTRQLPC